MRRTRAPLDLYCFYIFLQQENAEDALDCWLDMQQHENLCRAYFKVSSIRHFRNLRVLTMHCPLLLTGFEKDGSHGRGGLAGVLGLRSTTWKHLFLHRRSQ